MRVPDPPPTEEVETEDDPSRAPENRWRSHAHHLFGNWINELYQTTPFDLDTIGA